MLSQNLISSRGSIYVVHIFAITLYIFNDEIKRNGVCLHVSSDVLMYVSLSQIFLRLFNLFA